MTAKAAPRRFAESLLAWYDAQRRDLPFRRTRDPYSIWVSEVMLQQTQVQTVLPYYERWMARFPDVRALARAEEPEVLHAFQGLGYYSRARSLLRAAREVVERFDGELPRSAAALGTLPGIGAYTAGAVASIAFDERVPVVDGNVVRVLCRAFALRGDPAKNPLKRELWVRAERLLPRSRSGDFNQALMELGATLCTPRSPRCERCPIERVCAARAQDLTEALPELAERPKPVSVRMAAALVFHGRAVATRLLAPDAPRWAGMWQFPNVELEAGESERAAAERAARSALRQSARASDVLGVVKHSVTRYRITLTAFRCELSTRAAPSLPADVRFCDADELADLAMPSAHRRLARLIQREARVAHASTPSAKRERRRSR
jgi:A/G-specific adenine glycosylase